MPTKGISMYAHRAAELGAATARSIARHRVPVRHGHERRFRSRAAPAATCSTPATAARQGQGAVRAACAKAGKTARDGSRAPPPGSRPPISAGLVRQGEEVSLTKRKARLGDDVTGLQELILYGLKGAAAYADHARILGYEDPRRLRHVPRGASISSPDEKPTADELLGWAMKAGELNLTVMGLLDAANTGTYGHPEPTAVRVTPVRGKCICVSGHDLKDLDELLKQTEGKGINVYTHGEMLPCHAYPELEEVQAPGGQLRRRLAGPADGVRGLPRRDPDDDQLHPEAEGELPAPHLHQRAGGLAGRAAHRAGPRFHAR